MNLTLNELLPLVGRLDSSPGFDTPRERYRRFLLDHVTDVQIARALVEDCERSVGEQHHRALQDLIVLVGRFLGFETIFGMYERPADGVKIDGHWRSRGLLDVVLEVRTDQTSNPTAEHLARAVAATTTAPARTSTGMCMGLAVVARHYVARGRLQHTIAADANGSVLRTISVQSLLSLASQVVAARVSHVETVKLLQSGGALDLVIDLVDRPPASDRAVESIPEPAPRRPPAFWVATIFDNETPAAELLASVVAHRQVLGICRTGTSQSDGSPGDWVCFFLPNRGIAGHARLASVVDNSASIVRSAEQFSRVYRLTNVELYEEPVVQALRAGRPFEVPPPNVLVAGPCLSPIARQDFMALTTYRDGEPSPGLVGEKPAGEWELASGRTSR